MDQAAAVLARMASLQRIRRWTRLLDTRWTIPGTRWRFGVDPLLGLIPGVGGAVTLAASAWLMFEARRVGAPWTLLLAMLGNVAIDFFAGEVPIAGDIFDFAFKPHVRNLAMLEKWLVRAAPAARTVPAPA